LTCDTDFELDSDRVSVPVIQIRGYLVQKLLSEYTHTLDWLLYLYH